MTNRLDADRSRQNVTDSAGSSERSGGYTGLVYLGDRNIAWGSSKTGATFNLSDFLRGKGVEIKVDDDKFPVKWVYLRTESGNIYAIRNIDDKREILDARTGDVSPIAGIDLRANDPLLIRVGEEFQYQISPEGENPMFLHTSKVVEIVARSEAVKSDTEVQNMAQGRESTILKDFEALRKAQK